MIGLATAIAMMATPPTTASGALELCRPALARKAGGDIASVDIRSSDVTGRATRISGRLVAFSGMAAPGPGSAGTHHLIRFEFDYSCEVRGKHVVRTVVQPTQ